MNKLQKLLELDNFLKNFELYKDFLSCRYKNEIALMEALKQLKDLEPLTEEEMKDYTKFNDIIKKIDTNNYLLEQEFSNYDFSQENVSDILCDYKISVYEFVKDNIQKHIEKKEFSSKEHLNSFIENSVKVLWEFFNANFFVSDGFSDIFQKASIDITASYDDFKSQSDVDDIDNDKILPAREEKKTVNSFSLKTVESAEELNKILDNFEESI